MCLRVTAPSDVFHDPNRWFLLLDADEVIDGARMAAWISTSHVLEDYDIVELATYEYGVTFEDQNFVWSHAGLLIRQRLLERKHLLHTDDRFVPEGEAVVLFVVLIPLEYCVNLRAGKRGVFLSSQPPSPSQPAYVCLSPCRYFYKDPVIMGTNLRIKLVTIHSQDLSPMVHHYSFARPTRELLARKVLLSGHFADAAPENSALKLDSLVKDLVVEEFLQENVPVEAMVQNESVAFGVANYLRRKVVPFVQQKAVIEP